VDDGEGDGWEGELVVVKQVPGVVDWVELVLAGSERTEAVERLEGCAGFIQEDLNEAGWFVAAGERCAGQ